MQLLDNLIRTVRIQKDLVLVGSGIPGPLMHLLIGLGLFALVYTLLRRPVLALLAATAVQLINEIVDLIAKPGPLAALLQDSLLDTIWTLAIPAVLAAVLIQRKRRG